MPMDIVCFIRYEIAYEARFAGLAAMIADPTRARMLSYLLDGHYAPCA
jgi:hypothetical protein